MSILPHFWFPRYLKEWVVGDVRVRLVQKKPQKIKELYLHFDKRDKGDWKPIAKVSCLDTDKVRKLLTFADQFLVKNVIGE